MREIMTVAIVAAILIMISSIYIFGKSRKRIDAVLMDSDNVGFYAPTVIYLCLLVFFLIGYAWYAYTLATKKDVDIRILITAILFFGSVFVFISMVFLKRLINNLMRAKLNQTDAFTGLLNKDGIKNAAEQLFRCINDSDHGHAVIVVDLDNFKAVNDRYGHNVGDRLLKGIAETIRNNVRGEDLVGRFGGDEFIIILFDLPIADAASKAEDINRKISEFCEGMGLDTNTSASIGVAYKAKTNDETYEMIFDRADKAMYRSKMQGKKRVSVSE